MMSEGGGCREDQARVVGWRVGRRKQLASRDMLLEVDQEGVLDLCVMKEGGRCGGNQSQERLWGRKGGGKWGKGAEEPGVIRG